MNKLEHYIPSQAKNKIFEWLESYQCNLKICSPRLSKLGDYQYKNKKHFISVNDNLNPYSFLITLTHEIAHMMVFNEYGHKVKPHGYEWKITFQKLMLNFIPLFPKDIQRELSRHIKNPKASTTSDPSLITVLENYNTTTILRICNIKDGTKFYTDNGKEYVRLHKVTTRIKCKNLKNNKLYLFNPICSIHLKK